MKTQELESLFCRYNNVIEMAKVIKIIDKKTAAEMTMADSTKVQPVMRKNIEEIQKLLTREAHPKEITYGTLKKAYVPLLLSDFDRFL